MRASPSPWLMCGTHQRAWPSDARSVDVGNCGLSGDAPMHFECSVVDLDISGYDNARMSCTGTEAQWP